MTFLAMLAGFFATPGLMLLWDCLHGFRCDVCDASPGHQHESDCGSLAAIRQRRRG